MVCDIFFFFSSRRRHTRYIGDWSSDVCSSDLAIGLLHHFHEVAHLVNHAAHRRRVLALHHLLQSPQAQAADGLTHVIGAANEADHPLDLHVAGTFRGSFLLRGHALLSPTAAFSLAGLPLISSTVFERVSAT